MYILSADVLYIKYDYFDSQDIVFHLSLLQIYRRHHFIYDTLGYVYTLGYVGHIFLLCFSLLIFSYINTYEEFKYFFFGGLVWKNPENAFLPLLLCSNTSILKTLKEKNIYKPPRTFNDVRKFSHLSKIKHFIQIIVQIWNNKKKKTCVNWDCWN